MFYYYLQVIAAMFLRDPPDTAMAIPASPASDALALGIARRRSLLGHSRPGPTCRTKANGQTHQQ
jgi:hypothetical protein